MVFPATALDLVAEMYLAGAWTDITADVYTRDGITINRGVPDEATTPDPATCTFTLNNRSGTYSPRNPTGAYYGLLGRNTPVRFSVGRPARGAGNQQTTPGTAHVAPSVTAASTGLLYSAWITNAQPGNYTAPAPMTGLGETDQARSTMRRAAQLAVAAGPTGTRTATFAPTTGSASYASAVSLWIPGASATTLGGNLAGSSDGVLYDMTVTTVGASPVAGDWLLAVQGWESDPQNRMPRNPWASRAGDYLPWQLVADSGPGPGPRVKMWMARAWRSGDWTVVMKNDVANGNGTEQHGVVTVVRNVADWYTRFVGEVSEFPSRWDLSGNDVWVPCQASGITRRLTQGASPLFSPIRRDLSAADRLELDLPMGYWPCEDAEKSTTIGSGLPGGLPGVLTAASSTAGIAFATNDQVIGSAPLPDFSTGGARFTVPTTGAVPGYADILVSASFPETGSGPANNTVLFTVDTTGSYSRWTVRYQTAGGGTLELNASADSGSGAPAWTAITVGPVDGANGLIYLNLQDNLPDVSSAIYWWRFDPTAGDFDPVDNFHDIPGSGTTFGVVRRITLSPNNDATGVAMGHVAAGHAIFSQTGPWRGWFKADDPILGPLPEDPVDRIFRLADEQDIEVNAYVGAGPVPGPALGLQKIETLVTILNQAATVDGGFVVDAREQLGLFLRTGRSMYATTAATLRQPVTLTYTSGHLSDPLEPTDDDQHIRNDVTVNRIDGSTARATLDVGALSTLPPPNGVGRYDTSEDINTGEDSELPDHAAWRLHLGTWDESRYPSVRVNLAGNPTLIPAVAAVEVGDRINLASLPAWLPPGPAEQIVRGYSETLQSFGWDITFNCAVAGPYRVQILDDATYGRLDSLESTLSAGATSTATSLSVAVAAGGALWTTTATRPTDFPFDILIAGERMTVTAISGTSSPQTFTVTRSVNGVVKAQASGAAVRLYYPAVLAL